LSDERNLQILENRLEVLRQRRDALEVDLAALIAQANELRTHDAFASEEGLVDWVLKIVPPERRAQSRATFKRDAAFLLGVCVVGVLKLLVSLLAR